MSIALFVITCILLAANAGLTYAVVALSKDTEVNNNVLVSKSSNQPLATSKVVQSHSDAANYLINLTPEEAISVTALVIPCVSALCTDPSATEVFRVASVNIYTPGEMAAVTSVDGRVIVAAPNTLQVFDNATVASAYMANPTASTGTGRRLLQDRGDGGTVFTDGTTVSPDGGSDPPKRGEAGPPEYEVLLRGADTIEDARAQAEILAAMTDEQVKQLYDAFKKRHGFDDERVRRDAGSFEGFEATRKFIIEFNTDKEQTSWAGFNFYADLTDDEFKKLVLGEEHDSEERRTDEAPKAEYPEGFLGSDIVDTPDDPGYVPSEDSDTETKETRTGARRKLNAVRRPRNGRNLLYTKKSVDWVKAGKVTERKDQGGCGSCVSFAVAGEL